MNNKNLAIGAFIVVLVAGLLMYFSKETPVETQTEAVQEQPVVAETAAAAPPVAQEVAAAPVVEQAPVEPESLGASSSGLGR